MPFPKRNTFIILIIGSIVLSACAAQAASPAKLSTLQLKDCVLTTTNSGAENVEARCGTLSVRENPTSSTSRLIDLNIAVVPAITRNPKPDPLFILVGGPGQAATETYPAMSSVMFRIHQLRDIVLVDQRGTGKSHPLRCLNPEDKTLEDEQVIAQLKSCPTKLDVDLHYYTTDIAMQDLDQVRTTLGYETINLYGVSYGTRAALVYMKLFPTHVRSVILDAVVDPEFILYQDAAQDGQKSLDAFLARCEADQTCASTYPDLRSELEAVLKKAEQTPQEVTIAHPITGRPLTVKVTHDLLSNILFNILYVPDLVAMLPLAIHEAFANSNYAPLIAQGYLIDAGIYDGMFYAAACTEDAPLISAAKNQDLFGTHKQTFLDICKTWPHGDPPAVVHTAFTSDTPVLMLSGEADPITPPWHAAHLIGSLHNSRNLIFKGMGHGNSLTQCAAKIMDQFLDQASVNNLDTACVQTMQPPPFFVGFSGPQP